MPKAFTNQSIPRSAPPSGPPPAPLRSGAEALLLFATALLLLLFLGQIVSLLPLGIPFSLALSEIGAVLLPALLWSRARFGSVLRGIRLLPFSPAALLSGLLLGASWFYLIAVFVEPFCERLLPMPPGERERLLRLLMPLGGPRPLWQDLLCFAAVPALCEEVLFRGVLLRLMLRHLRAPPALVFSALLFGLFHTSLSKLLPTALLGLGFGAAVLCSGSLWAAMAMHFTNNTLVIVLVRAGMEEPPPPSGAGLRWLGGALLAGALGLVLLWLARRQRREG